MSEVMQTIPSWIAFIFHCGICCAQGILAAQHAMIAKKLRPPLLIVPNCGACLSSSIVLKSFSRLSTPYQPPASSGNLYLELLFRYNLGMPLYLWLVSLLETFKERWGQFFWSQPMCESASSATWVSSRPKVHKITVRDTNSSSNYFWFTGFSKPFI